MEVRVNKVPGEIGYLTENKTYHVKSCDRKSNGQIYFVIEDDEGDEINCMMQGCPHLRGGNWEVVSE